MESLLLNIARDAVDKAAAVSGVTMAEAYVKKGTEIEIDVQDGRIETIKSAAEHGIGMRIFCGDRMGFAYTTALDETGIADIIRRAVANAEAAARDRHLRLPDTFTYPQTDLSDPDLDRRTVEEKTETARRMERAARDYDPRIDVIESATYRDGTAQIAIANNRGVAAAYKSGACGLYTALTAGHNGESQTGFAMDFRLKYVALDPEKTGREAAERAVRMLGARQQAGRETTLILEPNVVVSLLGVLAPALTGEAVQKGRSLFADRAGEHVASELVTVVDDGALPDGIRSAPFDGEGVPTRRTVLIENGVLNGFLHNTYTAAKGGTVSTGNGVRGSFKGTPEVGATNLFLAPGDTEPGDLMRDLPDGLLVTEVMGMHTANPISGDFSVGASGLWIKDGRLSHPVRGMAMAGNITGLLEKIDAVGCDLRFFGGTGAPSVRVREIMVSGA